jgi:hypothetical protein
VASGKKLKHKRIARVNRKSKYAELAQEENRAREHVNRDEIEKDRLIHDEPAINRTTLPFS